MLNVVVKPGNHSDMGSFAKKPQYNPAAPDWSSLAPANDIPEFLPQSHVPGAQLVSIIVFFGFSHCLVALLPQ